MKPEEFLDLLRRELPKLLQEDGGFRARIVGTLAETLGSKAEFASLLEELRALRASSDRRFEDLQATMERRFEEINQRFEEVNRRFELIDRRFDAVDKRFEAVDKRFEAADKRFEAIERTLDEHTMQLRELRIAMGSLGGRMGHGLEDIIRQVIEEFSGVDQLRAERMILKDETGTLFGVPGAHIEFDAYVHNGRRFLVEVKSYLKQTDVFAFHRKAAFAEEQLGVSVEKFMFSPAADRTALESARGLQIVVRTFSVFD